MKVKILKEINLKKKTGQMMFKIRMANTDQEKRNVVYREYGVADYEGNVIDMQIEFFDIKERMYQTNKGLPYSELFPKLNYEEEVNELIAVIMSPMFIDGLKNNKCLIKGEKVIGRIEKYRKKLAEKGITEKEMLFLEEWKRRKDYTTNATYENMLMKEDLLLVEFTEEDFKNIIKGKQIALEEKYGSMPEHWIMEREV